MAEWRWRRYRTPKVRGAVRCGTCSAETENPQEGWHWRPVLGQRIRHIEVACPACISHSARAVPDPGEPVFTRGVSPRETHCPKCGTILIPDGPSFVKCAWGCMTIYPVVGQPIAPQVAFERALASSSAQK